MGNLRVLVYETDGAARKKLVETLVETGFSVIDAFDPAFAYEEPVYHEGTEEVTRTEKVVHPERVVDEYLWLKPEGFDGMIIGGPENDRKRWSTVMNREVYRVNSFLRVFSHCAGNALDVVEEEGLVGNINRDLDGVDYVRAINGVACSLCTLE